MSGTDSLLKRLASFDQGGVPYMIWEVDEIEHRRL